MTDAVPSQSRWAVAGIIAWRDAGAVLSGLGVYVALSVAMLAAVWVLLIDVRALEASGLLVLRDPFRAPLEIALFLSAYFFAVAAAVSVARERESGTLEVLFWCPVDELSYVLGKALGLLFAYVCVLPLLLVPLALLSLMTGFALTPAIALGLALSIVPVAEIVALGVLLSVGAGRVRSALQILFGVTIMLLGLGIAYRVVQLTPISDPSSAVLPLRDALAAVDAVVRNVSPFAYLDRIVDGVVRGAWGAALLDLSLAIASAAVLMLLAALWLRRRGVERTGE